DGNAERRAGHVVHAHAVAELHRARLAAMLAADADFQVRIRLAAALDGNLHQLADAATQRVLPDADPASGVLKSFMEWADEFRGKIGVRANADMPRDAKVARKFGAEGIGLCRTEHMFFAEDRIEHINRHGFRGALFSAVFSSFSTRW